MATQQQQSQSSIQQIPQVRLKDFERSEFVNVKEVAALLRVSIFVIYGLAKSNAAFPRPVKFPGTRRVLFKSSEIMQFVDRCCAATADPIVEEEKKKRIKAKPRSRGRPATPAIIDQDIA